MQFASCAYPPQSASFSLHSRSEEGRRACGRQAGPTTCDEHAHCTRHAWTTTWGAGTVFHCIAAPSPLFYTSITAYCTTYQPHSLATAYRVRVVAARQAWRARAGEWDAPCSAGHLRGCNGWSGVENAELDAGARLTSNAEDERVAYSTEMRWKSTTESTDRTPPFSSVELVDDRCHSTYNRFAAL